MNKGLVIGLCSAVALIGGAIAFYFYKKGNSKVKFDTPSEENEEQLGTTKVIEPVGAYAKPISSASVYLRSSESSTKITTMSDTIGIISSVIENGYTSSGDSDKQKWYKVTLTKKVSYQEKGMTKSTTTGFVLASQVQLSKTKN